MKYLNYDRIKSRFLAFTGSEAGKSVAAQLFDDAEEFVLEHLNVSPEQLDEGQKSLCEYAAAAVAVYDHSVMLSIAERPVMSKHGEVSIAAADSSVLSAASELRKEALERLSAAGLTEPHGFAFIGV